MGNWQLELFKMTICITFPVAMFYVFNQPQIFEEWVIRKKRELYPPESMTGNAELRQFIKSYQAEKESELLRELQEQEPLYKN